MKIFISLAFAFAVALGLIYMPSISMQTPIDEEMLVGPPGQEQHPDGSIIPGSYIVTLKPESVGSSSDNDTNLSNDTLKKQKQEIAIKAEKINEDLEEQNNGNVTQIYDRAINGFAVSGVDNPAILLGDPAVQSVEPDREMPLDRQYQSTGIGRIGLNSATNAASRPDNRETKLNVDVAVVDTIVRPHPDLNLVAHVDFVSQPDAALETHGTHVAGLCCAKDNLGGVVGPAQGARVTNLEVCGGTSGTCSDSARIGAANYIISSGIFEVATMSCCGAGQANSAAQDAISNVIASGVTYFRSAGNQGEECVSGEGCSHPTAIVVGALTDFDGKCGGLADRPAVGSTPIGYDDVYAEYSNWGSFIDIISPGTAVLSTWPGDDPDVTIVNSGSRLYIGASEQGNYAQISGTSMATPLAAGVGALVKTNNPSFTPAQIKSSLQSNAYSQNQACAGGEVGTIAGSKGGFMNDGPSGTGISERDSTKILWAGNY
jgi:subtilisin family serine protease